MKDLKSQMIIRDGSAKIIESKHKILKFITISLHIREARKGEFIKLGFKMKNAGSLIVLKIILKAVPSIKSTIIVTNYRLE